MMKKLKNFQGVKESIDVKEEMRFESILRMLIRLGLAAVFVLVIAGAAAYKAIH